MKNSFNLNALTEWLIGIITIVVIIMAIRNDWFFTPKKLNFVELQMRYKHYTVSNKYQKDDKTYVLCLLNPITDKEYKVYVAEYLYMCVYFIGDTIK